MPGDDVHSSEVQLVGDVIIAGEATANAATNLSINAYLIEKSLGFADCEIAYAEELYCLHKRVRQYDGAIDDLKNYARYTARGYCGMAMGTGDVIRSVNREMFAKLSAVGMYNSGKARDIIESSYGRLVDEMGPQMAMAYREEERLEDLTYYSWIKQISAAVDRGSLYVGTSAMASVADNQLLLAAKAARAAERSIASATSAATRIVDAIIKDKDIFQPRTTRPTDNVSIGIGGEQQPWYGADAPVRPDNPGGYTPSAPVPAPPPPPASAGSFVAGESVSTPGGIGGV